MQEPNLVITFRRGRAVAAYYHLSDPQNRRSRRSKRFEPGLIVDYDEADEPLGIEITAPGSVELDAFNRLLVELGSSPISAAEFAPISAA